MKKLFIKCTLDPKFWDEKQNDYRRVAHNYGLKYVPKPVSVHYVGNIYSFDPDCELPESVARELSSKRIYIKMISEPYEKFEIADDPTDAIDEDINKFGRVYLCKHCGWPFPKVNSRNVHERRWCKRKDN